MNELQTVEDDDKSKVDPQLDGYYRAEAIVASINANLPDGVRQLPPIPKGYVFRKRDRETVSTAIHAAFELIGGVPAFMQWGMDNPDKFYGIWSKLAQSDTETAAGGTTIVVHSPLPPTSLDLVRIDSKGKVINPDGFAAADDLSLDDDE